MSSTVIITGANSSLAIPTISCLLEDYPSIVAILTVRNATTSDQNTQRLRSTIARYPNAKTSIHELDLANLAVVHDFANSIIAGIDAGKYPALSAIICNAYYWDLVGDQALTLTGDGHDKTFQVNHIAHAALVLRLLGKFTPAGGRVLSFSSDAHWPGKNVFEKIPPAIPDDLDLLVNPAVHEDSAGAGFQRYANSKLAIIMWTYALNRYLQKDPNLKNIVAIVMNPGNLVDSRALHTKTPTKMVYMQRFLFQPFQPLLRLLDPTMRRAHEAASDVVNLAVQPGLGEGGFFTLLNKDESSPDSYDENAQQRLWLKTFEWAGITKDNTALQSILE
ncbi:putative short-chain dehydrogenase [Nemania sp. FL0031]|nr:putative short-chain dehydrogenase [Nemania sp. FL0031]